MGHARERRATVCVGLVPPARLNPDHPAFPTDLMIVANGAFFGFWNGLLVSVIGAMASACLAFGIARTGATIYSVDV